MGSTAEFQKLLIQRDDRISELEKLVARQRDTIDELNSRLDKYQSVMQDPVKSLMGNGPGSSSSAAGGRRRVRTTGISAEPGGMPASHRLSKSQHEFTKDIFKTHPKSHSSKKLIEHAISENEFLRNLGTGHISEIVELVHPVEYKKDSWIIKEGDEGSEVFVLEEGNVEVIKDGKLLRTIIQPTVFGELAVLYNCTRTASIKAVTACKLWAIERKVYHGLMVRMEMKRQKLAVELLKGVPRFRSQPEEILNQIADALEEAHYKNGEYIVRQGARGDTFYIIANGRVQETKRQQGTSEDVTVKFLEQGEWFGEKALDAEESRNSNYIAASSGGVNCLIFDRETYLQLIRKVEEVHRMSRDETKKNTVKKSVVEMMCMNDLTVVTTLGVGGFSRVQLVQIKGDLSRTYALKKMKKIHIKQMKQEEHIINEKTILSESKSDFITKLYRTFKDSKYLYMLMEACLGGEVWSLLRNKGSFDENGAKFYSGSVIEALRYLHSRGIVYRDLKPENMLIDSHGYMKLVDFGFAKKLKMGIKTWTFCGTPEYVSPEIILNKGHDHSADLWSLGVLIYELLTGSPPFQGPDQMQTYNAVLKGIDAIEFSRQISKYPKHLIKKLCRDNPAERLGYGRSGMKDLEKHKWYESFNWDGLRQKTLKAPYPIQVKCSTDVSNFDTFPDDTDGEPADDNSGWDKNF